MQNENLECLNGQVAFITGGSRGIGYAVCERLASMGAACICGDIIKDSLESIVDGKVIHYAVYINVSDEQSVDAAVKQVLEKYGKIDILVNNAGISIDSLLIRSKAQDWLKTISVNLTGSFYCAKAVAKCMMKERYGRIINISSVIGQMGNAGQVSYSSSKAGLIGLTKSLARELASRNITVNAVAPGYIKTPMTEALSDEQKQAILNNIPLASLGEPEDVAHAIAYFVSPSGRYVTGQVLGVNGGLYM